MLLLDEKRAPPELRQLLARTATRVVSLPHADAIIAARGGAPAFAFPTADAGTVELVQRANAAQRGAKRTTLLWCRPSWAPHSVERLSLHWYPPESPEDTACTST